MPAEQIALAIERGDMASCVSLLRPLSEVERRALYPPVSAALRPPSVERDYQRNQAVRLALLGTATLGELKKVPAWRLDAEHACSVLRDRRPPWLADWADFELGRSLWHWPLIRSLVRENLIPKPDTEPYTTGMIVAPGRFNGVREFLEADPELLSDEVWRLFAHEGSGEFSLAAYDKYVPEARTWQAALCSLAADGILDRARLLRSSLGALLRDFAPFRAGWFARLHDALRPTLPESIEMRHLYLDLLSSRVPATVSFTVKTLVELEKADALTGIALAEGLTPALEARDKGTVLRALGLIERTSRRVPPGDAERITAFAARALAHDSPDVQAMALKLIGDRNGLIDPYRHLLAPSLRPKQTGPAAEPESPDPPRADPAAPRIAPLESCEELVEAFGAVLENQGPPEELERVLDGVSRIAPEPRLTKALAKRAAKLLAQAGSVPPRTLFAQLALAWIQQQEMAPPAGQNNLADFLHWRVWHIAGLVAARNWRPLLSLPSWPDGRIDPAELERRIAATRNWGDESFRFDLALARTRAGQSVDSEWPRMEIRWRKRTWQASGTTYSHCSPSLVVEDSQPETRFSTCRLSLARLEASLEMRRWCTLVCPHWREGWFAAGCRDLGDNLDWWEARWANRAYLEPLVHSHTSMGPMACLLLALGLSAKETGEGLLAADALVAAVSQGRLEGAALGRALAEASPSGAIKWSRWAKQLARVSQTTWATGRVLFDALEVLFASGHLNEAAGIHPLIELQLQLAHFTQRRMTDATAIKNLAQIPAGDKTKRLRDQLLGI
jgi:hypothetical protein